MLKLSDTGNFLPLVTALTGRCGERQSALCRLTDIRRLQAAEKRRGPYERRVYASMRVFERYQSVSDADALCQGLFLEQQLRGRIEGLKALRRIGARTFLQGEMLQVRVIIWLFV
jgi:hypothetical protein